MISTPAQKTWAEAAAAPAGLEVPPREWSSPGLCRRTPAQPRALPQPPAPCSPPPAPRKPWLRTAQAAQRPAQPDHVPRPPQPGPGRYSYLFAPRRRRDPDPLSCCAPGALLPGGAGQGRPHCPSRPRGPAGTGLGGPPPPARCACPAHLRRRARRASARQPGSSRLSGPSPSAERAQGRLGVAAQGGTGAVRFSPAPSHLGRPGRGGQKRPGQVGPARCQQRGAPSRSSAGWKGARAAA